MPRLTNGRHEVFAQNLARGMSQVDAYGAAGFVADRTAASRLSTNANVQARVAELQERAAANAVITREWVIEQLVDNARVAKTNGDIAPANRALEMLGKHLGMFVDRVENTNLNYAISDTPLTEDEWVAMHAVGKH